MIFIGDLKHNNKVISSVKKLFSNAAFMLTNNNTTIEIYKFNYEDLSNLNKVK